MKYNSKIDQKGFESDGRIRDIIHGYYRTPLISGWFFNLPIIVEFCEGTKLVCTSVAASQSPASTATASLSSVYYY